MSAVDHSHVGCVTDVQWLSSVTFTKEGATPLQVMSEFPVSFVVAGHLSAPHIAVFICHPLCMPTSLLAGIASHIDGDLVRDPK